MGWSSHHCLEMPSVCCFTLNSKKKSSSYGSYGLQIVLSFSKVGNFVSSNFVIAMDLMAVKCYLFEVV
jgi:hypothetical protein